MKSKKKNNQGKRNSELFGVTSEVMEIIREKFYEHKIKSVEAFLILNTIYTRVCDMLIENRNEGISIEEIKYHIFGQIIKLMNCVDENLPLKIEENEQTK